MDANDVMFAAIKLTHYNSRMGCSLIFFTQIKYESRVCARVHASLLTQPSKDVDRRETIRRCYVLLLKNLKKKRYR